MNRSKQKGNRFERECVKMAENHGFSAERAYGSNGRALGESETVDIVIRANGEKIKGHILLTDHNDACWYRNIKIKELP